LKPKYDEQLSNFAISYSTCAATQSIVPRANPMAESEAGPTTAAVAATTAADVTETNTQLTAARAEILVLRSSVAPSRYCPPRHPMLFSSMASYGVASNICRVLARYCLPHHTLHVNPHYRFKRRSMTLTWWMTHT
jgi:hypothetical protein